MHAGQAPGRSRSVNREKERPLALASQHSQREPQHPPKGSCPVRVSPTRQKARPDPVNRCWCWHQHPSHTVSLSRAWCTSSAPTRSQRGRKRLVQVRGPCHAGGPPTSNDNSGVNPNGGDTKSPISNHPTTATCTLMGGHASKRCPGGRGTDGEEMAPPLAPDTQTPPPTPSTAPPLPTIEVQGPTPHNLQEGKKAAALLAVPAAPAFPAATQAGLW